MTNTTTGTLAAALVAFQGEVPPIPKNRVAKMGSYSYRYADINDMWDALREPLHRHGLAVTQPLAAATQPGHIAIRTTIWHESGETHAETAEFPIAGRTPQEIGSAITYAKRYALAAALGISVDDDDDGNAGTAAAKKTRTADTARAELLATVRKLGLDSRHVGQQFIDTHGTPIGDADADTITAFTRTLKGADQ